METDPINVPSVVSVMVVHEPGDWFEETVRSLAAQDYPNLRSLFLVTPTAGAGLVELTARIRAVLPSAFVRELPANVGFGPAIDEVLRLVEGDNGFFLVCHDDVALEPRTVRTLVAELFRSNAGIVGPKLLDWDHRRLLQHVGLGLDRFGEVDPLVEPGEVDQEQHDAVRDVFVLPSACLLVRADLFRTLGGFDPELAFHGDDVDLCWRAHLTGARVVVVPDARVRHRERLVDRRPDINHQALRSRHRMRTVATLTGASRLLGRSVQLVVLTLVEVVVGLFTGRLGEALSSLRALVGLIPRTGSILRRRRQIRGQRVVPEREVLGLQDRGSSRLTSYLRGRDTETFVAEGSTVRRWREASFGPLVAWVCVILAIVIGSRGFIRDGVPAIGDFLPFPDSPRQLLNDYRSSFDSRSFGATTPTPTGWAVLAFASVMAMFRMSLLMTMSVVGMLLVGALGAWRLATVFPSGRSRIAGMVVYVGSPLIPALLHTGNWGGLAWFAGLPWLVHLLRRAAGLDAADPASAADLTDGVATVGLRHRVRATAFAALVLALVAAFLPVAVAMFVAVWLLLAVSTLLVGGSWRVAAWFAGSGAAASVAAFVLNLPWAAGWGVEVLRGPAPAGASGRSLIEVATFADSAVRFPVLAVGLYAPVLVTLAVCRAWRLTWSARGAALVVGFGAAVLAGELALVDTALPSPMLLAVPVVLGLAICAAALAGSFGADVVERGFGWRQPAALLGTVALVIGLVPAVLSIGHGAWRVPDTPMTAFLATQLPDADASGDYRVLYVGHPRVLPVSGHEFAPGVAYAVVDGRELSFVDRFPLVSTPGDDAVERALALIAGGSTLRAGRLLAPLGIRYVIVPEFDGVASTTEDPLEIPNGLVAAFANQLDVAAVASVPSFLVFVNEEWFPVGAQLVGSSAQASASAGDDVIVRADFAGVVPSMHGVDGRPIAANEVVPGVVHVAVPFEPRLRLDVDGIELEPRPGFGVTTAFDVAQPGVGRLAYERDGTRTWWLAAQLLLWLAVIGVAAGAHTTFGRRRTLHVHDETLIDLDEADGVPGSIAGEVLAPAVWASDDEEPWTGFGTIEFGAGHDDAAGGPSGLEMEDAEDPDAVGRETADAPVAGEEAPRAAGSTLAAAFPARRQPVRDTTPGLGIPIVGRAEEPDLSELAAGVDEPVWRDDADEPNDGADAKGES